MSSATSISDAIKSDPQFEGALSLCVASLRRLAQYEMETAINERMQFLGERKEFLDQREHDELMSLVGFSERRTKEKLEAQLALKRLSELAPELVE